ncbi:MULTISPECIES: hypothetical protein [Actinomadura]|uniref:DUF5129 domain-containing protein n=1 Tax=Actinomadura yumaensis TaxID=111807 RepID=A0ABW2CZS5_9ACTN|nr:hypothetical protein [Actinomadura sp. J1-007]MWK39125.1 hypothetical protein [Actinomadura sp. J1-007]
MSTKPSPGETLAAALRRSPIHVDRSLSAAMPAAERRRLAAAFRRAPAPVFVLLVPLVKGGTWSDPEQLATVVHDRLGRDGIYVTLDDAPDQIQAYEFGGEWQARDAAWAVNLDRAMNDASLVSRLDRLAGLLAAGTGTREYRRLSDELDRRVRHSDRPDAPSGDGGGAVPLAAGGAAAVAVAGVAGLLVWRRRRMAAVRRADAGLLLPRTVFSTAGRASEEQLREQASREVVAFGELLDGTEVDTARERPRALLTRALDAYQAAGKALDGARGVADLAGVLVLVDQGRDALASARSVAGGGAETPPSPLCFFDPLHGDAAVKVDWRPVGTRRSLEVRACRACAKAVRARRTPEILMDRVDGRDVPYFEADPDRSVWAATGYGQLRDDLVHRVLRGDLGPRA